MELNRANLQAMTTGFQTVFNDAFAGVTPTSSRVAMEVPSNNTSEQYAWLGSMPRFREWLGSRVVQNLSVSDFTIKNKTFEMTVGVKRESIEDDSYGVFRPMIGQMGAEAKRHPDELVYSLLKGGFTGLCYDGQYFFDTDHPGYDAAGAIVSVSNMQAGAATPWYLISARNFVKPLIFQKRRDYKFVAKDQLTDDNVFDKDEFVYGVDARANAGYGLWQLAHGSKAALDATTFDAARTAMSSLRGPNGKSLGIVGDLLVVPPSLEGAGRRLLHNETAANGATNEWKGTAELLVVPDLA
ncbi:Mu-like prophage major head subunit gpT family protein [Dongia sp.]|uniref:Mu-like prophage major head subunit gpT family protein n=1 Tax=Dongia sp. TaxID=1977262 RepID=UPI0035B063B2